MRDHPVHILFSPQISLASSPPYASHNSLLNDWTNQHPGEGVGSSRQSNEKHFIWKRLNKDVERWTEISMERDKTSSPDFRPDLAREKRVTASQSYFIGLAGAVWTTQDGADMWESMSSPRPDWQSLWKAYLNIGMVSWRLIGTFLVACF